MSSETTKVKQLKQEDWPAWFDFIRSEAIRTKIWRIVDPSEKNIPTKCRTGCITDTTHETSALTEPPIDPKLEQYLAGQDHAGR
ncbi:hypothetical protein V8E54_013614 [Elaphomyces granulatus]